jgi:hypothetical protein
MVLHTRNLESKVNIHFVVWAARMSQKWNNSVFMNAHTEWLHWSPLLILCFVSPSSTYPFEVEAPPPSLRCNPSRCYVCFPLHVSLYIFYVWTWLCVSFALSFSPLWSTLSFLPYLLLAFPFYSSLPPLFARGGIVTEPNLPIVWSVRTSLWQRLRNQGTL